MESPLLYFVPRSSAICGTSAPSTSQKTLVCEIWSKKNLKRQNCRVWLSLSTNLNITTTIDAKIVKGFSLCSTFKPPLCLLRIKKELVGVAASQPLDHSLGIGSPVVKTWRDYPACLSTTRHQGVIHKSEKNKRRAAAVRRHLSSLSVIIFSPPSRSSPNKSRS